MDRRIKKVLAIHDLCAHGRVSLKAVTPILTTMAHEVYPLPTALLSAHTQYPNFTFTDLTDQMVPILENWKALGVQFDAIYTGYLGSPRQVDIVKGAIRDFKGENTLVVIDPVMGDNGKLYTGFTEKLVTEMRRLIEMADVITPNLTEVAYLLDKPFDAEASEESIKADMKALATMGPKEVVVTGVGVEGRPDRVAVLAYNRLTDTFVRTEKTYLKAHLPGTGDAFAAVLTGALMKGDSMAQAIDRAAQFVVDGIDAAITAKAPLIDGMLMEAVLPNLRK